jgi:hypothetical protein
MTDLERLAACRRRLHAFDTLLDWHLDLLARIRRAQLRFEICDCEHDDADDELGLEVEDHLRVVRVLTWSAP